MSIKIPLKLNRPASVVGYTAGDGAQLNLPVNVTRLPLSSMSSTSRQVNALLAVAAAVSLAKADDALKVARESREFPEKFIAPSIDDDKLKELIAAVNNVQDDPSLAETPTTAQQAAAHALGVNASLVRAAYDKLEEDPVYLINGLAWVAAVNGDLLDKSAREGARQLMLDKVPARHDLASLETRMESLEATVKQLQQICPPGKAGAKPAASKAD